MGVFAPSGSYGAEFTVFVIAASYLKMELLWRRIYPGWGSFRL